MNKPDITMQTILADLGITRDGVRSEIRRVLHEDFGLSRESVKAEIYKLTNQAIASRLENINFDKLIDKKIEESIGIKNLHELRTKAIDTWIDLSKVVKEEVVAAVRKKVDGLEVDVRFGS
jgi:uncharacterized protein YjiS (DUF1127 family)